MRGSSPSQNIRGGGSAFPTVKRSTIRPPSSLLTDRIRARQLDVVGSQRALFPVLHDEDDAERLAPPSYIRKSSPYTDLRDVQLRGNTRGQITAMQRVEMAGLKKIGAGCSVDTDFPLEFTPCSAGLQRAEAWCITYKRGTAEFQRGLETIITVPMRSVKITA